ncbi:MAG: hypothetical protein R3C31_10185 [Hyphomonadaceae bacterium]
MKTSLLRQLAISGVLFFAFATAAQAQTAWSGGGSGGQMAAGTMRTWAFNVPAGNYVATARVAYQLQSNQDTGALTCQLKPMNSSEFWDYEQVSITGHEQSNHTVQGEITLMSQVPIAAPGGAIEIQCRAGNGQTGTQRIYDVRLEMIAVRSLNELTPIDTSGPVGPAHDRNTQRQRGATDRHQ